MARREQFADARKTAGFTQESLANSLRVGRTTVVRWEAGEHEPLPYVRPKLARLLGISPEALTELLRCEPSAPATGPVPTAGRAEREDRGSSPVGLLFPTEIDDQLALPRLGLPAAADRPHPAEIPRCQDRGSGYPSSSGTPHEAGTLDRTLHAIALLSGEDLNRRDFLLGTAFSATAFAEPALFAMTAPALADAARTAGGKRIGMTDVAILTDTIAHLRGMDFRYGSGRIRERAVQLLHREATALLRGSYSAPTGRAVLTAVAQAARLAASMATDVGRHALAQRYYIHALDLALSAGNRLFAATMLSDMSRLTIQNATGQRSARQAVALARAGTAVAGNSTATLTAQLRAMEARGHALCQDTSAARTAILDAQRHYERRRPEDEPAFLSFYTEAELAADLGRALRDSGQPEHATRLLAGTLDSYEPWRVRSRCFVQIDLAAAYLRAGDPDHVAALTRDALDTARKVSSGRTVSRIRALQHQMQPRRSAVFAELDEEITGFLRHAHDDEDIT